MNAEVDTFVRVFGERPTHVAFAPGRVNLIGEHIDYLSGAAIPMAIQRGVTVAASRSVEPGFVAHAASFNETVCWNAAAGDSPVGWAKYVAGVISVLRAEAIIDGTPLRFAITSDLPIGAGISSSAALTVAVAKACANVHGVKVEPVCLARVCQRAETAAGVPCGEMDFLASILGVAGHALRVDFVDPPRIEPIAMFSAAVAQTVLVNTHVHRRLADGRYAALRDAAREAEGCLGVGFARRGTEALIAAKNAAGLSAQARRCIEHTLSEMTRTDAAERALRSGDPSVFGRMMRESHASLSGVLGVSCPELDFVADRLNAMPGVFGARMMGGGFGGGVIALVTPATVAVVEAEIPRVYAAAFASECRVMPVSAAAGAWGRAATALDCGP